jgi:hypothetical protein
MKNWQGIALVALVAFAVTLTASVGHAANLKPYVLASNEHGAIVGETAVAKAYLQAAGFTIVGEYAPYDGAQVLVVTDDELKKTAAQSTYGGYAAALRVSITQVGSKVQVAYNNPTYTAVAYRLKGNLAGVAERLKAALGFVEEFGSEKGVSADKLKSYKYMPMMPQFTDQDKLAEFPDFDQAVAAVEAGLAAGKGGTAKIYRVDIPGKQEVLFGVAIKAGKGGDKTVMDNCDRGAIKHTPHLPYEILVSGNKVLALKGKFRIAQSFPDLTMGTFMKISAAPGAISKALEAVVGK